MANSILWQNLNCKTQIRINHQIMQVSTPIYVLIHFCNYTHYASFFEKLGSIMVCLYRPSVCASVRSENLKLGLWNFIDGFLIKKLTRIFTCPNYLPSTVMPLLKYHTWHSKLGQLIDGEQLTWWKFKIKVILFYSNNCPFQIWNKDTSKNHRSLNLVSW